MKILAILVLAGLGYGAVRFILTVVKELALFAVEAWRDIEVEQ
ncbi:hypothetical protein ACQE3E_02040 [Methylomonas sp. MED-D]|nr:hypothetical protein [Methylomonas sp. MV1]MDT4330315.1 hypothetical protein [Methylomonas sp. MV1]